MTDHADRLLRPGPGSTGPAHGVLGELRRAAQPPENPDAFRLDLDPVAGRLTTRGRLDRDTAHLLHDAIAAMLATQRVHWTVNVTDLVVPDHFALRVLTTTYRRLLRQGRRMTLEGASPELQHTLTRLRLDHHLLPHQRPQSDGPPTHAEPAVPVEDR